MNIKKILSVALALSILLVTPVNVYATNANFSTANSHQKMIHFDEQQYANLSAYDTGVAKMLESGHTTDLINSMPQKTVASIAGSNQAIQSTRYYMEEKNGSSTFLRESSLQEHNCNLVPSIVDPRSITVVDSSGNVLYSPSPENRGKSTIITDNGSIEMKITLYLVDSVLASHYLAVSEFIWTTMPSYRGTDFFGITRDDKTVVIQNESGNYTAYDTKKFLYFATPNGVTITEHASPLVTSGPSLSVPLSLLTPLVVTVKQL